MKNFLGSGNVLVSIAALLWGTSFVAIKWAYDYSDIDPLLFVFLRFAVATLFFLPFALYLVKGMKSILKSKAIILVGFFNAISFTFQFLGQPHTTAGKASLFVNFYAIIVPLIAPLILPEKYTWRVIVSCILGFTGVFFVTTNLDFTNFQGGEILGDLLTLGSGISWAIYILVSKKFLDERKDVTGLQIFFGTIVWTTLFLVFGLPYVFTKYSLNEIKVQFTPQAIGSIFYLAIICTVAAFAIYMIGLKKAEAGESVIFMLLEVVIAFILEGIILFTFPDLWEIIGAIMIIFAMIITSLKFNRITKKSLKPEIKEE